MTSKYTIILLLVIAGTVFPQQFSRFDKSKIDSGMLYIYDYSKNSSKFKGIQKKYIYIKNYAEIECISIKNENAEPLYYENYIINWDKYMLSSSRSMSLKKTNKIAVGSTIQSDININYQKKYMSYRGLNKTKEGSEKKYLRWDFERIPTYFYYQTDLLDLCFALRFYPQGKKSISVNNNKEGYDYAVEVVNKGAEYVKAGANNIRCIKYEVVPKMNWFMGLFYHPQKAWIWLSADDNYHYIVKYRNDNERSTFTQSMEYRIAERKTVSITEWKKMKNKLGCK